MKAWTVIALLPLLACAASAKEDSDAGKPVTPQEQRPAPQDDLDGGDGWTGPCDRERTVQTFKFDGGTWTFTVPTLCDPTPYIEKGDPPWQTKSNAK